MIAVDVLELAGFGVGAWALAHAVEWVYRRNAPTPPADLTLVPAPRTPRSAAASGAAEHQPAGEGPLPRPR